MNETLIKELSGHSGSKVFLLQNSQCTFVRKINNVSRNIERLSFLQENGYTNVANLNGGLVDWDKDKLPMKVDKYAELSGSCACMLKPMRKIKIIKPN